MSIKKISNYNTGIDLTAVSISEATYMLNSFIEESINDIQTKCLLADKRSLNESGIRYFTEENDTGKQKLGDKIKQIIKTVWDVIVGIFKKIRDFFKDMITKIKEFFSKIQQKFFGKKEDKKEEPKATEKPAEKKDESKSVDKKEETKPEEKKEEPKATEKPAEKKDESKSVDKKEETKPEEKKEEPKATEKPAEKKEESKPEDKKEETKPEAKPAEKKKEPKFNTGHIYSVKGDDGIYHIKQKDLIGYMRYIDDKAFRESIDKNVTRYFDTEEFYKYSSRLANAAEDFVDDTKYALNVKRQVSEFLKNPIPTLDKRKITRGLVLDCAFGNFSISYKEADKGFKYAEKEFDNLYKAVEKIGTDQMSNVKDFLKLTTECSKRYSTAMIHNSKELVKVVQYIYKNYDLEGVSVKESVDWSSIL